MWPMRDQTAVVGIGQTEYTKRGGIVRSEFQVACEAVVNAVADAGLRVQDIDGLVTYEGDNNPPAAVAQALGIPTVRFMNLYPGGGNSAAGVVHNAAMAVYSGTAEVVVSYRSICQGQTGRFGSGQSRGAFGERVGGARAFTAPFGVLSPAQGYAFEARRHMHEFGTTSEQLGAIAVASYKHAEENPQAVMRGTRLTLEDHQNSRMIVDPYHLFDCCQESDGACALVTTSAERARSLPQPLVLIAGAAQGASFEAGSDRHSRSARGWTSAGLSDIAADLYKRAGVGPGEIDVAQFYENFTGQVLMAIEDLGFCRKGEGGAFVEGGTIEWPDGDLPINTSGGNLAEGYIHGLNLVLEAVRQARGTSTAQVEGAEHSLVVSGPSATPSSALILRRGS